MKEINQKVQKWMEDNVFLNKRRYEKTLNQFGVIDDALTEMGYQKIEMQGSFATRTAIKPKGDDEEYDLDVLVQMPVSSEYELNAADVFFDAKENLKENMKKIAKENGWNAKITDMKVGININLPGDSSIDIVPVFIVDGKKYIYHFMEERAERSEPFLLTNKLKKEIDINKRILMMIIKRLIANECKANELTILPSIGMSILCINDIAENNNFSLNTISNNIETIIKIKPGELYNPFVPSEEFYSKNGRAGEWEDLFIVLDSIRLTLNKIFKAEDFDLFVKMMNSCFLIPSNGIQENTGSGGHA